jgi:hypothetical protein
MNDIDRGMKLEADAIHDVRLKRVARHPQEEEETTSITRGTTKASLPCASCAS